MARFSEDFIRRVREANDIVQVIESYNISLRQTGASFVALCPFHNEKTASFNIRPADQFYKCFGCDVKGDVIRFIQDMERIDFPEAIESLAARAGIPIEQDESGSYDREGETRKALRWINSKALKYYEESFWNEVEGRTAREYLLARGFTKEVLEAWRVGWAPDSWDGLVNYLVDLAGEHRRIRTLEIGLSAGVFRRKEQPGGDDRYYDAFRGRVMFPIFDVQHRPVGFGGRVLEEKPESGGKYINTAEGSLFEKRKILYGLNFAAKEIGLTRTAIVVEGYTDTMMCHQYGVRNAVAAMGAQLTKENIQRLRRHVQQGGKVIALFDADEAGERATDRAIRDFMEEDLPLQVVRNLEVKDACEFLPTRGEEAFRGVLEKAEDSFYYILRRSLGDVPAADVGARSSAVGRIMEVVNLSPSPIKRAMMRKTVAAEAGIPEEALPQPVEKKPQAPVRRGFGTEQPVHTVLKSRERGRQRREQRLLYYMFEQADWAAQVMHQFPPEDFEDEACAETARLIRDAWGLEKRPTINGLISSCANETTSALIADLATEASELQMTDEELKDILKRIGLERVQDELRQLGDDLKVAEQAEDKARADEIISKQMEIQKRIRELSTGGAS